jgi:hypothetical protein
MLSSALPHLINHPSLFEYQANGLHSHQEQQMVSIEGNSQQFLLLLLLLYFAYCCIQWGMEGVREVANGIQEKFHINVSHSDARELSVFNSFFFYFIHSF